MDRLLHLELPSDLGCIEETVELVLSRCEGCEEVARRLRVNFRVCLAEALANAMIYGNGHDPEKRVTLEVVREEEALVARVTDQGTGFDPGDVSDPTLLRNVRRVGGRGIFLMRQLMDEVVFNDQGNSVTLVLRFSPADDADSRGASA